jgi:hypothetical protein
VSTSGADLPLAGVRDIRLSGVTLSRSVRNNYDAFERCLRAGGTVRIALIDPESRAPAEAALRCGVADQPEVFDRRLRPTIDLLRQLCASDHGAGSIEVRLLPYVPAAGLTLLSPTTDEGRILVDVYAHRPVGPEPVISLSRGRDPRWYAHFLDEWDRVWAGGRPADWTRPA